MVEYIRDQGERYGERELAGRIVALENHTYARWGAWASVIRLYARLAWREFPGKAHTHYTLCAKEQS